jgi:hypothetical protein
MSRRLLAVAALACTVLAGAPTGAAADTTSVSSNWAGYVATGAGFTAVSAAWVVPAGTCTPGRRGYSATWVGLGGFGSASSSLEQIGTEFDCTRTGRASYSAWYELVPTGGRTIRMRVRPGDAIEASVSVQGTTVGLRLRNRTRGSAFSRTLTMQAPDVSSADWIVEAPSDCTNAGDCTQLPLSNFGTVRFDAASATSADGHSGSIADPAWTPTAVLLRSSARAVTSSLSSTGTTFRVTYRRETGSQPIRNLG